jgi:hypothetical protein
MNNPFTDMIDQVNSNLSNLNFPLGLKDNFKAACEAGQLHVVRNTLAANLKLLNEV